MASKRAEAPVVVVIPASLASVRLPRKLLLDETGKPLILHTCDRALSAKKIQRVIVATASPEIQQVVEGAGIEVMRTAKTHRTGTDRVGEVASGLEAPFLINLQADEPEIDPGDLDRIAETLREGADDLVTLAQPIGGPEEWEDRNTVKVVFRADGNALYFSRASIPSGKSEEGGEREPGWKHIGVYGFSRERLLTFCQTPRGQLERREGLEQLRALEQGWPIRVLVSKGNINGINAREDYVRFVASQGAVRGV